MPFPCSLMIGCMADAVTTTIRMDDEEMSDVRWFERDEKRWRRRGPWVYVNIVGRGQEFVFDIDGTPKANAWLRELFDT